VGRRGPGHDAVVSIDYLHLLSAAIRRRPQPHFARQGTLYWRQPGALVTP
jgi:hypothetical protein